MKKQLSFQEKLLKLTKQQKKKTNLHVFIAAADRLLPDVRLHPDREGGNAECEKKCR